MVAITTPPLLQHLKTLVVNQFSLCFSFSPENDKVFRSNVVFCKSPSLNKSKTDKFTYRIRRKFTFNIGNKFMFN